jgi:hypothetical protein
MWWRRASECLNLRYQASHEESHISKCQSLLNQDKVIWRSKVKIDYMVWSIPSHNLLRVNAQTRSSVATLMKSKRDEVVTITLCKLKLEKCILYLILSIGMPLHQERYYIDCQQNLMLNQKTNYPSERRETQWPHTLHISLNQEKPDGPVSQTGGSSLGRWAPTASSQIPDVLVSKTRCSSFYWLVVND